MRFGGQWARYAEAPMALRDFLGNLCTHTELFTEIDHHRGQGRILEVGVGTGSMSIFLSWLGYTVTAIDTSVEVLAGAARNHASFAGRPIRFVEGDAFELPFPADRFDVAFHQGLLEHFSDEEIHRLLDEQLRVAPVVVASVPNENYPRRDFGDERLMSQAEWERILAPYEQVTSRPYFEGARRRLRRPKPIMYLATIRRGGWRT